MNALTRVLVGGGLLVVGWCASGGCDREPPARSPADIFANDDILVRSGSTPGPIIPPPPRSGDPDVDAFVERFVQVALAGNYSQYRLMTTYRVDPVDLRRFRRAWEFAERIEVVSVEPLSTPTLATPPAAGGPSPTVAELDTTDAAVDAAGGSGSAGRTKPWVLTLRVLLRESPRLSAEQRNRTVRFLIQRERADQQFRARPLGLADDWADDEAPASTQPTSE